MGGLCVAARARELGASPVVLEKGDRPGGSMLLSSGFVWRYRTFEEFRAQCPGGDPPLQRLVFDPLDEAPDLLQSPRGRAGAPANRKPPPPRPPNQPPALNGPPPFLGVRRGHLSKPRHI